MLLQLEGVKKKYKKFELDCSLNVEEGKIIGVIGRNGAGKSTTFKAILDIIHVDEGKIRIFDKDISTLNAKDKEKIGVVLADSGFSEWLTVGDIAAIMDGMYEKFDKAAFLQRCEEMSLPLKQKTKEFSSGMKARLKLLLAISYGAKLLVLDEPTAGLDVIARQQVLDLLREYMEVEGRSILISSHISSDLEGICDEIYMIENGKIILHEDTDDLLDRYGVLKVTEEQYAALDKRYLVRVQREKHEVRCLTDQMHFYVKNYPELVIQRSGIDDVITLMISGKEVM